MVSGARRLVIAADDLFDTTDATQQPSFQKRASQACHQCRARKVKCDVIEIGSPCSNCRLDEIECITSLSKRSRRYRQQKARLTNKLSDPTVQTQQITRTNPSRYPTVSVLQNIQEQAEYEARNSGASVDESGSRQLISILDLPCYIFPSRRELGIDEVAFLRSRGAFSIPESNFRNHLLLAFIQYVYPFLPVLDLQEFLDAIELKSDSQVSLILFQAVMFAGSAFVDLKYILNAGFQSRLAAREYLFQKIKILYDLEWENDRVTLIQATLLHQYWYPNNDGQKDPWYWLGVCISLATSVGMNQANAYTVKTAKTSRLWRRLWWTCVSRDRDCCLTTHKPLRIKDYEIGLPHLSFKDFDTQPITTNIDLLRNSPLITDCLSKVMLADMFMSKLELAIIIGRIMERLYVLQSFIGETSKWLLYHVPKQEQDLDIGCIAELQEALEMWPRTINNYSRLSYVDDGKDEQLKKTLVVSRGTLRLSYLMAQEALHRPRSLSSLLSRPQSALSSQLGNDSRKARMLVKEAASDIFQILNSFRQEDLLAYLPPLSVGCILTAIASSIVDMRLARSPPGRSAEQQSQCESRYQECFRCLEALQDVWPIIKPTCAMARRMLRSNQTVFARNTTMLSCPMIPTGLPGDHDPTASSQDNWSQISEVEGPSQETDERYTPAPGFGHDGGPVNVNPWTDTYLATMYPISWTASDLDYYDDFSFNP